MSRPHPAVTHGEPPDPGPLLAEVVARYRDRVAIATSLGPQTLVILDVLHRGGLSVPVFFLDTGVLFDETYALRRRVEARYGLRIRAIRADPPPTAHRLWERDPDLCCHLRKVAPLRAALTGLDAWITGLRRDQSRTRSDVAELEWDRVHGLVKVNPLAAWRRDQVLAYLHAHDVPFNPLLDRGFPSVGCRPCTRPAAGPDERAGRWSGSDKTECGIHHLYETSPSSQDS